MPTARAALIAIWFLLALAVIWHFTMDTSIWVEAVSTVVAFAVWLLVWRTTAD